jgi:hypothetical protein
MSFCCHLGVSKSLADGSVLARSPGLLAATTILLQIFLNPKGLVYFYFVIPILAALFVRIFSLFQKNIHHAFSFSEVRIKFLYFFSFQGVALIGADLCRVRKVCVMALYAFQLIFLYMCCFDCFDLTAQEGMCCLGSLPMIPF